MTLNDIHREYRLAAVQSASPPELVVMLYDLLNERLRGAIQAFDNVEVRANKIKDALEVLAVLQSTLNMAEGGEAAANLDRFYSLLRQRILRAHAERSPKLLEAQAALILQVREAWAEVCKRTKVAPAAGPAVVAATDENERQTAQDWSA